MAKNNSQSLENRVLSTADIRAQLLEGMPVKERKLDLAGIATSILEGGSGDPVLLLHGPGEYAAKWLRIIPDLAKKHRVIAPDLPGHGASAGIGGTFDEERIFSWLDGLISSTCSKPPVLIGQILGGAIATRYAARSRARISRLVLVDALGLAPFQPNPDFGKALQEFMMKPSEETHDHFWGYCAYNLDVLRDNLGQKWDLIKAYNLDRAGEESLQATQHSLMEQFGMAPIPPDELKNISVPTALIWGKHDLATDVKVAEAISARYGWPLNVIDNAADDPALEQPEAFLNALYEVIG